PPQAAAGPPPAAASYPQPPAMGMSEEPAWQPGPPAYQAAARPPMETAELMTLIGISVGIFFIFLLIISTFLRWVSGGEGSPGFSGTRFGDSRIILLLSLALTVAVGLNFLSRRFLSLSMVVAGALGTLAFMVMVAHIGRGAGAGIYVGLVAALGVMGGCI